MQAPLPHNSVIGILGAGQLGRMLAMAAAQLGLRVHVFAPDERAPAHDVSAARTIAAYDDAAALAEFARTVDVVTFEFENVPAQTIELLEKAGAKVAPGKRALEISQDRLTEKNFINGLGAKTAHFFPVDSLEDLKQGLARVGAPAILKTRRLGYDGKGQTVISPADDDLEKTWESAIEKAWREIGAAPSILEGFVDFDCEISIIGARDQTGAIAIFDPSRNEHRGGILRRSTVPSGVHPDTIQKAKAIAVKMLEQLAYVGVMGVEFFVLKNGDVVVNEFAPRVHNSGHWTSDACAISQFEQHIRAVAGWPLGSGSRHSDAVMDNLIGDDVESWRTLAENPDAALHLYGKRAVKPGRKMGHVTILSK